MPETATVHPKATGVGRKHRGPEILMRPRVSRRGQRHVQQQRIRQHPESNAAFLIDRESTMPRQVEWSFFQMACALHIIRQPINIETLPCLKL